MTNNSANADRHGKAATRDRNIAHLREAGIRLPTFAQLAAPDTIPAAVQQRLATVDPDTPDPANLFRVHWYNDASRRQVDRVPGHIVLEEDLTGVPSPIILVLGDRFPMIHAHKVQAAYACLVPRLVSGAFDATYHRALWPSTGNYCRGGVAISRILGCRGVAILPEGMSQERFDWLEKWVLDPQDVVRTPGTESNVKEIYDRCDELESDPTNMVLNQFSEFGNHLGHYTCTGPALARAFRATQETRPNLACRAFVSASGSAGTLGAGDFLKEELGAQIVAAEALECPTMLYNGFGEHNIQGIGDKHIPFIHNVTNTDFVAAISDRDTDGLDVLFQTEAGHAWLQRERGLSDDKLAELSHLGFSSICNLLAAIKVSKHLGLGSDDAIVTVATDGAELYDSEREKCLQHRFGGKFTDAEASAVAQESLAVETDHVLALEPHDRDRIFNLGYFTWVEQRGVSVADFEVRRSQQFWQELRAQVPLWDQQIEAFNQAVEASC